MVVPTAASVYRSRGGGAPIVLLRPNRYHRHRLVEQIEQVDRFGRLGQEGRPPGQITKEG